MKYIYLLFLFCLFGCTRTTNKQSNIKNIYLEQSNIQDFIGLPIQLTTLDSVLFINDFYGDSLIHCISLKDNKPIAKLGVKGSGPNEVLSPLYILSKRILCLCFHVLNGHYIILTCRVVKSKKDYSTYGSKFVVSISG